MSKLSACPTVCYAEGMCLCTAEGMAAAAASDEAFWARKFGAAQATYTTVDPYRMNFGQDAAHELVSVRDSLTGRLIESYIRRVR